ncbi:MAG: DUF2075 domain-containing protein [Usitatibacter sp.]
MTTSPTAREAGTFYHRAWYGASVADFLKSELTDVLGVLSLRNEFDLTQTQRNAWTEEVRVLQEQLVGLNGALFLEFTIPRMGRRIDAALIVGSILFVIEFKVGEVDFDRASIEQVWDYALDLKNFHQGSHAVAIVPILVATLASPQKFTLVSDADRVYQPVSVNNDGLRSVIDAGLATIRSQSIDSNIWAASTYQPTPTIVEAARALYSRHSVEAIARFDAGAKNLRSTSSRIEELVELARREKQKIICLVTGVPGAGKTLVGLNVATRRGRARREDHAVFLSGNGPLVDVLREALTRDEVQRKKDVGVAVKKGRVAESVKAFIQNVHHFRDDALATQAPPIEHVVIFDEAQRAWNLQKTASFMQRKKGRPGFSQSEPEFLVSCMDRHKDWCVVVCLVGGGQEINTGEAGVGAWLEAIQSSLPSWRVYLSDRVVGSEYASDSAMAAIKGREHVYLESDLHLNVSMRSFRAENLSSFVKALLDCEGPAARDALSSMKDRYPVRVTRDLNKAKEWIRARARGSERFGLVASSKAQRLKPHALDVRVHIDPVHWFLNDRNDTRSSYYLEDAATEFQVQGLELDWVCVTWDGDLRYADGGWSFHDFRGSKWVNIANRDNRNYLRNAYRVLLTRARQGMVIFVPPGDALDPTRAGRIYDPTFDYLVKLGIQTV